MITMTDTLLIIVSIVILLLAICLIPLFFQVWKVRKACLWPS
jgi:hypothetical protein